MKNLMALARVAPVCRPAGTAWRGMSRSFATCRPVQGQIQITPRPVQPQSVEELVSFKAKYVKPETVQPLAEAAELYAKIHIHNWDLLVTEGDIIKLPVNMKDVQIGDTLVFDQVSEIGSRDYTLSGERIDPTLFSIKGTVLEKTRVKREVDEKTRRRRRHVRHVVSNNCLTVIRVSELKIK